MTDQLSCWNEWKGGEWQDLDNWNVSHPRWPETFHFQLKRGLHPMFTNSNGWPADSSRDASDKLCGNRKFAQLGKEDLLITETNTSLALKIIQHEDFRIHLEVKKYNWNINKRYAPSLWHVPSLKWSLNMYAQSPFDTKHYSSKFTNSAKIHI